MGATEMVTNVIRNRVAVMNNARATADAETMDRLRHELNGMMICLKNIATSLEFYCINYYDNGIEFGYYDNDSRWHHIEGVKG